MNQRIKLNDGNEMPRVGFCTFSIPGDGMTYRSVLEALEIGYRHIDTAAAYFNEAEVGQAVRDSGIPRGEIFVTSKLWLENYGYDKAQEGLERSLEKLGFDYIDLYMLNHPYGDVEGSWRALEEAQDEGLAHSIGVCNLTPELWVQYESFVEKAPAVLTVECHPYFQQRALRRIVEPYEVKLQAQSPEGVWNAELVSEPVIEELTQKYGKTANQIVLRFEIQDGLLLLPKPSTPQRMQKSLDIFDFELTPLEMQQLRALDRQEQVHNPDDDDLKDQLIAEYDVKRNAGGDQT